MMLTMNKPRYKSANINGAHPFRVRFESALAYAQGRSPTYTYDYEQVFFSSFLNALFLWWVFFLFFFICIPFSPQSVSMST